MASRSSNVSPVDHQVTKKPQYFQSVHKHCYVIIYPSVCVCEKQLEIISPSVTFLHIFLSSGQKQSKRGQDLFMMTLNEIHTCFQSLAAVTQPRKQNKTKTNVEREVTDDGKHPKFMLWNKYQQADCSCNLDWFLTIILNRPHTRQHQARQTELEPPWFWFVMIWRFWKVEIRLPSTEIPQ